MLTPIEIQSKSFRSGGLGYDKKDVDQFMREILSSYEVLYRENMELNDKVSTLTQGIQYYKTLEKTLQKALILAEKTAEETKAAALKNAKNIENEALTKSELILADAKNELERVQAQTIQIVQQYEKYKLQFKSLAASQLELLESECFALNITHLSTFIRNKNSQNKEEAEQELNLGEYRNSAALEALEKDRTLNLEEERNLEKAGTQKEYLKQDSLVYQDLNQQNSDLEYQTENQKKLGRQEFRQSELKQEKIKQQESGSKEIRQQEQKKQESSQTFKNQNEQDTSLKEQQETVSEKEPAKKIGSKEAGVKEASSKELIAEEIPEMKEIDGIAELSFFSIEEEQKKSQEEQVFEELESMGFDFINLEENKDGE